MGLLLTQGIDKPFSVMIASIKYNFYPFFKTRLQNEQFAYHAVKCCEEVKYV